jgi:AcrR family transcriptional regulator
MRRKDQTKRRAELIDAARSVLLEQGAVGLRAKDVAARAGLAPSSLLYYYPRTDELLMEVARDAMARYAERRYASVAEIDDPLTQLELAIELGVPSGPGDEDSRLLYEIDALTGASPVFASLSSEFYDRQVALYEEILEAGVARGVFTVAEPVTVLARGLVALEDGLGLQVVIGNPGLDAEAARSILRGYARLATGAEPGSGRSRSTSSRAGRPSNIGLTSGR